MGRRKDEVFDIGLGLQVLDDRPLTAVSTHTLERWRKKARKQQRDAFNHGIDEAAISGAELAQDVLRVLEGKRNG